MATGKPKPIRLLVVDDHAVVRVQNERHTKQPASAESLYIISINSSINICESPLIRH
jgi:hypothetical protein